MGNISCFLPSPQPMVKLVFWGGTTQLLPPNHLAGSVMSRYPDRIICHVDSFYIGHAVPTLAIEDQLLAGHTYCILPVDRLPCQTLTTASLASLSSSSSREIKKKKTSVLTGSSGKLPFEYLKGRDGRTLIKVAPEFIVSVISDVDSADRDDVVDGGSALCTTPELKKQYAQLVPKERQWSPKLDSISESKKTRLMLLSPSRLLGLDTRK